MNARNADDELKHVQVTNEHRLERTEDGRVVGHFLNSRLSSVFQPILEASGRKVAGHAAYVRAESDENVLSPWEIFALAAEDALFVSLDRLCRTLHAINYFSSAWGQGDLFVSVQPRLLESVKDDHGRAFEKVLGLLGVATSRVVIEIPTEVNRNSRLLKHVVSNYRSRGYRIAANLSGTSDDWMSELGSLYPNIVRLDASALREYNGTLLLPDTIRRFGAVLWVRDIETAQQVDAAIRVGADLLQGRFFGGPARTLDTTKPLASWTCTLPPANSPCVRQ